MRRPCAGVPVPSLVTACVLALLAIAVPVAAEGIENPSAALIGDGVYRLDFSAPPDAWPIRIYVSSHADRIDRGGAIAVVYSAPTEITVSSQTRVYFHLRPAVGHNRVVALRRLPLAGAFNFRDLGGYRANDGRYVKWGLVYRSSNLVALTPKDYELLNSLGLKLLCDLRRPSERVNAPTVWQGAPGPEFLLAPILSDNDAPGTSRIEDAYRRFVLEFTASYAAVFQRLARADLPMVTHCTAGQDRTGVFSAVLLTMLGVPKDTVVQDYLLTNVYRELIGQRPSVQAANLDRAFMAIDERWGSFDAFVRDGLGLSDAQVAELRDRLLER
jgi:protein-tyrosine phosphatase